MNKLTLSKKHYTDSTAGGGIRILLFISISLEDGRKNKIEKKGEVFLEESKVHFQLNYFFPILFGNVL